MSTYTARIYDPSLVLQHTTTNVVAASGTWVKNGVGHGSFTFPGQDEATATATLTKGWIVHVSYNRGGLDLVVALFNIEGRTFSLSPKGEELVTVSGSGFEDRIGRHLITAEIHDGNHGPALDDIQQIMAYQPGWSLATSSKTGTDSGTRHTFKAATILQALEAAAKQSGEMWRLDRLDVPPTREIQWLNVPTDPLSYNFALYFDRAQFTDESSEGILVSLARGYDESEVITRVRAYGAGQGDDRVTMLGATFTPPAGFQLHAGASRLINTALEATNAYNEREINFGDIALPELSFRIVWASADNDFFRVRGDHTTLFTSGYAFEVEESTGNDGTWTTSSSAYDEAEDWTTIYVTGDITDITADGSIVPTSATISAAQEATANALALSAYNWLKDRTGSEQFHRIRAIYHRNVRPGDKVRIIYANGRIDLDEVHQVVKVTFSIDRATAIRYVDLVTAPLDSNRLPQTEDEVTSTIAAKMNDLIKYGPSGRVSDYTGTVVPTMEEHLAAIDPHPTYLLADGSRQLYGNLSVANGATVDGVDISAHVVAANAHHDPATAGNGLSITGQELRLTQPGILSATSTNDPAGNHTHAIDATIARSAITITAGNGLTGGGNLTANRTLNVGAGDGIDVAADSIAVDVTDLIGSGLTEEATNNIALTIPGTLSASSTNVAAGNHTHAVTASSNPGTAASLLKTSVAGLLQLNSLYSSGGSFQSDDYVSQLTGWRVTYGGDADFRNIYADELRVRAFIADIEQALAGGEIVSKSVALLSQDFIVPFEGTIVNVDTVNDYVSVDGDQTGVIDAGYTFKVVGSTGNDGTYTVDSVVYNGVRTQIYTVQDITDGTVDGDVRFLRNLYVEDLPGFPNIAAFTAGDWVRLRVIDRSGGGLVVADVWGTVAVYVDQTGGEQRWAFTVYDDGGVAGETVYAGAIILDYGSPGDGYWEVTALDSNGPYSQVVTWTVDPTVPGNHTLRTRLGNLDGVTDPDLSPSGWGLYSDNVFMKGSVVAGGGAIVLDATGLFAEISSANTLSVFVSAQTYNSESVGAGDALLGDNTSGKANVFWDKSAGQLLFRGGTTTQAYIDTDGAIVAGTGNVILNADGIKIATYESDPYASPSSTREISFYSDTDLVGRLLGGPYAVGGGFIVLETAISYAALRNTAGANDLSFEVWEDNFDFKAGAAVGVRFSPTNSQFIGGDISLLGAVDISGDLAVNTDTLFVDVSTNRVGIGLSAPASALDVEDAPASAGWVARFTNTNNDNNSHGVRIQAGPSGTSTVFYALFRDAGGNIGWIKGDGAGGVGYISSSDARVKEDVQPLSAALSTIGRLRPVSYRGRGTSPDHARAIGLIAQDVQAHVPAAVSEIGEELLGVDYSRLVPYLIGAIQELVTRVEQLEEVR